MTGYILEDDHRDAGYRLTIKEEIQDPATIHNLEAVGVAGGWSCLEVGAGHGSIAGWLCRRVEAAGHVVATDLHTGHLQRLSHENLEIRRHDIASDPLEENHYDLVHARDLLAHLPGREAVFEKMVHAVKPGGWLLVEEPDLAVEGPSPSVPGKLSSLYDSVHGEIMDHLLREGLDIRFGARLTTLAARCGLTEIHAEGRVRLFHGTEGGTPSPHMTAFGRLGEALLSAGRVTAETWEAFVALPKNPLFSWYEGITVSLRARRPLQPVHNQA